MPQTDNQGSARVRVFDTTLRDGEQAPGFSLTTDAKLKMARQLARLRVDIIEAGFAAASPGDADAVRRVAEEIEGPVICSLSRTRDEDMRAAEDALAPAGRKRLHLFLGTSPTHRQAKLKMTADEVLAAIERAVSSAKGRFDEIEFSAEDAIRTERDFLKEAMQCAADAGADVLNVPDTVGYTTPEEIYALFADLDAAIARPEHVILSAHCHNDLGMAVANSLAAIRGGARQVECTINGIGERAGNCALEEVVMALKTRADYFDADTDIATTELYPSSRLLSELTGQLTPRNKAVVGRNAFAHEAGIHQHGMLEDRRTYEIMTPADVGVPASELVLGKHSGKHALKARAKALGHELGANALEVTFVAFKKLADAQREVTDSDLIALLTGGADAEPTWRLVRVETQACAERRARPFARVTLDHHERGRVFEMGEGEGPLQAIFEALRTAAHVDAQLEDVCTEHADGEARAEAQVRFGEALYTGRGAGADIVAAAAQALVDAFNRIERARSRPQTALQGAA